MEGILKDTENLECSEGPKRRVWCSRRFGCPARRSSSLECRQLCLDPSKPATPQPSDDLSSAGGAGSQGADAQVVPNVTHFAYHDINVLTYDGLIPHVKITSNLPLFQLHPHAKHLVRPAMIHAIKELIGKVTGRALKIAMTVTESLVRKDFAMDSEDVNMRSASFHIMRAMTAGMAMITCRDPLASTMHANLAQAFSSSLRATGGTPEMKQMIEEASSTITQDNVELSTNFIVKTTCEKATQEIEKRLEPDFQKRISAKSDGGYRDELAAAIHAQLPKAIATMPGPIDKSLMSVYEQFSSRICGFKANSGTDDVALEQSSESQTPIQTQLKEMEMVCQQLQIIIKEVDQTTQAQPHLSNPAFQTVCLMREMMQQVIGSRDGQHLMALVTRSTEHLLHAYRLEGAPTKNILDVEWARRLRDLFIGLMRLLQNYFPLVELSRRITTAIMQIRSFKSYHHTNYGKADEPKNVNQKYEKIRVSTLNFADKDAAPISQMIRNADEAIIEEYLEEFALVISEQEQEEKALEVFSFKITYDSNGIPSAEVTTGNQKLHEVARMEYEGTESVRRQLVKVVHCIQIICLKVLKPLPEDYSVNFRVAYTSNTPASYRIQGFADHSLFYKAHPECKNLVLGALRPNHCGTIARRQTC